MPPRNLPRSLPPSIKEKAFSCPHCGAFAAQTWYDGRAQPIQPNQGLPFVFGQADIEQMENDRDFPEEQRKAHVEWLRRLVAGQIDIGTHGESKWSISVSNLFLSKCF